MHMRWLKLQREQVLRESKTISKFIYINASNEVSLRGRIDRSNLKTGSEQALQSRKRDCHALQARNDSVNDLFMVVDIWWV